MIKHKFSSLSESTKKWLYEQEQMAIDSESSPNPNVNPLKRLFPSWWPWKQPTDDGGGPVGETSGTGGTTGSTGGGTGSDGITIWTHPKQWPGDKRPKRPISETPIRIKGSIVPCPDGNGYEMCHMTTWWCGGHVCECGEMGAPCPNPSYEPVVPPFINDPLWQNSPEADWWYDALK